MIKLIVDSTFGLDKKYIEENDIKVVSLKLLLGDKTFVEGDPSTWDKFFEEFEKSKDFPKTSQPNPEDFVKALEDIYKKDEDAKVIILTISSFLSGTINSANIARNHFENKDIKVIDSLQATVGSKVLLEKVVDEIKAGKSFEEVVGNIKNIQERVDLFFVPSTMEYLKRGGRIGTLSAALASVLSIKPIFRFKNGAIGITKKVLGLSKALNDMVLSLPKQLEKVYVCYIHSQQHVAQIVEKVKTLLGFDNVELMPVCPVFGAHVGIGAVGIAALRSE